MRVKAAQTVAAGAEGDGAELARAYRKSLIDARARQLEMTRTHVNRLMRTYQKAGADIRARISGAPEWMTDEAGVMEQARLRSLLRSVDARVAALAKDYSDLLDASMLNSAQLAADREAGLQAMGLVPANDPALAATMKRTYELSDGSSATVQFGKVAEDAVEALARRYYVDGLTLSERLGEITTATRQQIEDTLVQAVTEGVSSSEAGSRLERLFTATESETPAFRAYRIARTEIAHAHREGHIRSCVNPDTGMKKSYVEAIGYRLSLSHPKPDICDIWAADDSGLGPGNYEPGDVPLDHCFGLCWTATVVVGMPGLSLPVAEAAVDEVPESQVRYYADKLGDGPAVRRAASMAG